MCVSHLPPSVPTLSDLLPSRLFPSLQIPAFSYPGINVRLLAFHSNGGWVCGKCSARVTGSRKAPVRPPLWQLLTGSQGSWVPRLLCR